jgi:hypothetical protein
MYRGGLGARGVIALFSVLNRGIVAARMVASALFNIEHNLPLGFTIAAGTSLWHLGDL